MLWMYHLMLVVLVNQNFAKYREDGCVSYIAFQWLCRAQLDRIQYLLSPQLLMCELWERVQLTTWQSTLTQNLNVWSTMRELMRTKVCLLYNPHPNISFKSSESLCLFFFFPFFQVMYSSLWTHQVSFQNKESWWQIELMEFGNVPYYLFKFVSEEIETLLPFCLFMRFFIRFYGNIA